MARQVEVAVDAVGAAGGRTYTYAVPPALADLVAGEAVIVEFGRRQALGVVLDERAEADRPAASVKPVLDRVRSGGPLLPPCQLALTRLIAEHYLAPAAMVVRAALPPGTLERLESVARWLGPTTGPDAPDALGDDGLLGRVATAGPSGIAVALKNGTLMFHG